MTNGSPKNKPYQFLKVESRWIGFSTAFMYLSVFHTIFQKRMQLESPDLTQKCSTMCPENSFILGLKGQSSRSQGTIKFVSVFRQRNIAACYERKVHLVFPPHCPAAQAILATPGFPALLPHGRCCCRPPVFRAWSFWQSSSSETTLPAWVMTLL